MTNLGATSPNRGKTMADLHSLDCNPREVRGKHGRSRCSLSQTAEFEKRKIGETATEFGLRVGRNRTASVDRSFQAVGMRLIQNQ